MFIQDPVNVGYEISGCITAPTHRPISIYAIEFAYARVNGLAKSNRLIRRQVAADNLVKKHKETQKRACITSSNFIQLMSKNTILLKMTG